MTHRHGRLAPHLLGFGVFLLTTIVAHVVSGGAQRSIVTDAPTAAPVRERPEDCSVEIDSYIADVATRYGMSKELIAAIVEAESRYNPRAVSPRGAQGLMQLMPETAALVGVNNPFDPLQNLEGGVRHLRGLMDRFDNNLPLALAAYNAGERAVISYGGIPPYPETREYVSRILRRLDRRPAPTT